MRYSRLISPSLSRRHAPTFLNPTRDFHSGGFTRPSTSFRSSLEKGCYFIRPKIGSWSDWHFKREFTSTAQESKVVPSERVSAIVDEISGLTLLEVSDLTDVLRKKLNIDEMPMMAMMMPGMGFSVKGAGKGGGAAAKGQEKKAEKTVFDLKLEGGFGTDARIKIIKEVRAFTALGLKEAKELVDRAPTLLKKGVTKEEAEKIIEKIKEVGGKVTME